MIRAKAAFLCARRVEPSEEDLEEGVERIEILAEDEVTEDFEIGLRIHAAGYKSTFVNEKVATGEVRGAGNLSQLPLHSALSAFGTCKNLGPEASHR